MLTELETATGACIAAQRAVETALSRGHTNLASAPSGCRHAAIHSRNITDIANAYSAIEKATRLLMEALLRERRLDP